jgi:subfamily B ATP-binding cassette protein MsbA
MMQSETNRKHNAMATYKRLFGYVTPFWKSFTISTLGYLMYAATEPLFATLLKNIIDILQAQNREKMLWLPIFLVGLILIRGIGTFLGGFFLAKVATSVVHNLRCDVFNKYTQLPTAYFDSHNSGQMMSVITYNVREVTEATTDAVRTFVREGLTALGLLIYLFYSDWKLSLVFLAIAPVIAVMVTYVSRRLRKLSRLIQDSVGNMSHITSELVTGHRVVRSYGGKDYEKARFLKSSLDNSQQNLKLATTTAIHNPLLQLLIGISLSGLMYLTLFFMEKVSAGGFVGYLTAAFLLPKPIRQLSDANSNVQKGITAAQSLFEILDEKDEVDAGKYQTERAQGLLEFQNVSFAYPNSKDFALKNISFKALPGQTIALVGASGGGKSTVTNLILRFYQQFEGKILLDGIDITEYSLCNLRAQIALVTQQVTLFNDSVANNIAYGGLAMVSREKIAQAATKAYARDFIEKLPQGLETEIGENGVKLSGGQKQRLAIARALLKDAPLLILDEATSALDTESERAIQKALKKVVRGRTSIVIAHRLSTIEHADLILVIDKGQIVERGTHQELLAQNGAYSRLYSVQFEE